MEGTQGPQDISTRLERIAEMARRHKDRAFQTLAHHIDVEFLREAFDRTRKDGAVGVDGQTASVYAEQLEANLRALLERFKSGSYVAPPVRRAYIPKGDGKQTRPIGIPTFEDKVLQRAVSMVLEAVYEQDFLDCSYGFRRGRGAQDALRALDRALMGMGGGYVLEVDIKSFFDTLDHARLRSLLDIRIQDGVLRRVIGKWLNAGVMEDGSIHREDAGTPQGGVISPLLANVYLHEALDKWFESDLKKRLVGRSFLVRYADDFIAVFSAERDARLAQAEVIQRLSEYGLTVHPTKTRLLHFRPEPGTGGPGGFDFLGFTHYWGRTRSGGWAVQRKTASSRYRRTLKRLTMWLRRNLHQPILWQHQRLVRALRGHDAYYGVSGNYESLRRLRSSVAWTWRRELRRRSHRTRLTWLTFNAFLTRVPLPKPRIHHGFAAL